MLKNGHKSKSLNSQIFFLTAIVVLFTLISCSQERLKVSTEFVEFNTNIKFTAYLVKPENKTEVESLFYQGGALLSDINNLLDPDLAGSDVERINSAAYHQNMPVNPALKSLTAKALFIAALTDSSFDPAVYPLFKLWGFNIGNNPAVPDSIELTRITHNSTLRNIRLFQDSIRFMTDDVKLGFGAIAKGWAADSVAALFKSEGLQEFIIAAAGDIVVYSEKKKSIAVKHPRNEGEYLDTLYIDKGTISTSGDYERYFESKSKRYCHLINPRTGIPDSDCLSVTVVSDSGWKSDALATGIFVMGVSRAEEFMKKHHISGIISFLDDNNQVARKEINLAKYKIK